MRAMDTHIIDPRKRATYDRVEELILSGSTIAKACEQAGISHQQLYRLLCSERELAESYARVMEMRADKWADETIEIADTDPDPNRARNRIGARQWGAAKTHAKKYGERVDLNINSQISISNALNEARQRLRPMSDQLDVTDVEVHTPQALTAPGATDMQSVAPSGEAEPTGEPDIFS